MTVYWGDTMYVLGWPIVAGVGLLLLMVAFAMVCLAWMLIGRSRERPDPSDN